MTRILATALLALGHAVPAAASTFTHAFDIRVTPQRLIYLLHMAARGVPM